MATNPETAIQHKIMLALSSVATIFRNNIGMYRDRAGRAVRYGVCNPGGSDLVGWKSITVTPEMLGRRVAVFVAVEVKAPGGRLTSAQENFIMRVNEAGGLAGVARNEAEAADILCA